jgi:hypothetical protein
MSLDGGGAGGGGGEGWNFVSAKGRLQNLGAGEFQSN